MAAGGLAALGTWAVGIEPHWVEFVEREMRFVGLPEALRGKRLMQLSDLHVGPRVDSRYLIETLDRAAALNPDIVVVTGDFITYRYRLGDAQFANVAEVMRHIPKGRIATLGILGNHDYGRNWNEPSIAHRVQGLAEDAGIRVLRNERIEVEGLEVAGFDDVWGPRFDVAAALAGRDTTRPLLTLCHNPDGCDVIEWGDTHGWVLSGHTHGGQVRPPFLPPLILPVRNRRYAAGEVDLGHGRRVYINRGLGHLYRVRFNVRPEVTVFGMGEA
ncbi:MAG: phosphoesterase [Candidatus Eisenbacteria bacterium]|uniref:Phosphoesterase n=1 Tax=Eiseniibacteriota bacterium TaxID=2212470 RepID=A0A849SGI6_UNCEI|nr:phosphoesterase [Candidatus Eisenbacteria bacterium]